MAIELVEMEENDTVPGVVKMWCVFFFLSLLIFGS